MGDHPHERSPNTPLEFTEELRERYLGGLQGKKIKCFDELKGENKKKIETSEQIFKRAKSFINKIYKKHPKENILLVGHDGINLSLMAAITNKKREDFKPQHNTSINIFEIDEDKNHKIHVFNCTEHLK